MKKMLFQQSENRQILSCIWRFLPCKLIINEMSRKLLLTLVVSISAHMAAVAYFNQQESKSITRSMGSIKAPVSLTFSTVSNPVQPTKKQVHSEPLPEPVPAKKPEKPLSKPEPNSKPILKRPEPEPKKKVEKKKEPVKKEIVKELVKEPEQKKATESPEQVHMVKSALQESKAEGLSSEPVEMTNASIINQVLPEYPKRYQRRNIEGNVTLKLLVNQQGRVIKIDILKSSGFGQMDKSAITAVKQWVFKPEQRAGKNVQSWLILPIGFKVPQS